MGRPGLRRPHLPRPARWAGVGRAPDARGHARAHPRMERPHVAMQRTAEEFVHQLPNGRWFVGDFVRTDSVGREVFLVEPRKGRGGVVMVIAAIALPASGVRAYACK